MRSADRRIEKVLARIRDAFAAGANWVQIREKDLPGRELLALTCAAVGLAAEPGADRVRVMVNDRLDIALAAGAAGVHLGGDSLPAREVVEWCHCGNARADFLIGVSCHSLEQARRAQSAGANYVFFGPVFDTPSKRAFGPPQGTAKLAEVSSAVGIPVIAIGGLTAINSRESIRAGARGIAAIRLFQGPGDRNELRRTLEGLHFRV